MTMRKLTLTFLSCLGGLYGCGDSYILLEVKASLQIPTEANSLQVITLDAADITRELSNVDLPLEEGDTFPVEVLLDPGDKTPQKLRERVVARLDGVAVAANEVEHPWSDGRVNRASFELEPVE